MSRKKSDSGNIMTENVYIKYNNNLIYTDTETGEKYTTLYSIYHKLGYRDWLPDFIEYRTQMRYCVDLFPLEHKGNIKECILQVSEGCSIPDLIIPLNILCRFKTSHNWGHPINKLIDIMCHS